MVLAHPNISIRVVDVSNEIESYVAIAKKRSDYERFSATGVIRLLLPELLTEFDKILNLDCDMVLCADAAELDAYDLSEYYMGGVQDIICYSVLKIDWGKAVKIHGQTQRKQNQNKGHGNSSKP